MAKIYYIKQVNRMKNRNNDITIFSVANTFLNMESMSPKKLQKLCFYAYAWYMTLNNKKKLFNEHFEAWIHGPVNPALYQKYREWGWNSIPREKKLPPEIADNPEISEFIQEVYDSYGHLDADQLEYLTHNEDPWILARSGLKPYETSTNQISDTEIYKYYSRSLENE